MPRGADAARLDDVGSGGLETQIRDLERLHEATMRVARTQDWNQAAGEILGAVLEATGATKGLLSVCNATGSGLVIAASVGLSPEFLERVRFVPAGRGDAGQAFERRSRVVVTNAAEDPLYSGFREAVRLGGFRSSHCVPLLLGRATVGVLTAHFDDRHVPDDREMRLMDLYAQMAAGLLDRLRTTDAIQESESKFRTLATHAPVGIFVCDREGRCSYVNERWGEIAGVSPEEIRGRSWLEALHPEDHARVRADWSSALRSGRPWHAEFRFHRADGAVVWLQANAVQLRDGAPGPSDYLGTIVDVSSHRRMESDARLLAAIVEASHDAIISKDLNGVITSWNKSAEGLFGYTAEEAVGRSITLLIPPERLDEEGEILRRIRAGERIEHFETVRVGKSGRRIDISLSISPVRDRSGRIVGASKIARDISALKQSQAEVRQQTRTLDRVNQLSSTLVAELDLQKIVQRVTDAGCEISGARYAAFHFRSPAGDGDHYALFALAGEAAGATEVFPLRVPAVEAAITGGRRPVRIDDLAGDGRQDEWLAPGWEVNGAHAVRSCLVVPVISRTGEGLGALLLADPSAQAFSAESEQIVVAIAAQAAIAIDNANLYAALQRELEQHKRAENALRESEQQLRLVTDNAIVFLAQCDREYRLKFVNRPYADLFGGVPAELIGRTVGEVVGPAVYAKVKRYIDLTLAGERVDFETEITHTRLGARWVRVIHEPERAPDGSVVGLVAVITDITARKQAEREMEETRDKAVAASRAKDEFLAALSHELRTPLNPVLLLASEAAENPALPDRVRTDFDTVRKNVELEARLIDDLLDLTRITRGKLALTFGTQQLHPILQDALDTIRPEMAQKRLDLTCNFAAQGATVWGDAVRLQQVLWNVLKNAVKFTPDNGRIRVGTAVDLRRHSVSVEVVDSGIGMTEAELGRVFDAFAQGEHAAGGGSHRFGGLGLGLAISKMLAELHHGSIRATSEGRGRGSRFVIELPLAGIAQGSSGTAVSISEPRALDPGAEPPGVVARRSILLVEDHEPTRKALAQLLVRRQHEVTTAGTCAEARTLADSGRFDLLISDVGLPDGNGHELMAQIQRAHPQVVGIALTGYGMDHDLMRSQASGFAVHLTKPVTIQALDRALHAAALGGPPAGAWRGPA